MNQLARRHAEEVRELVGAGKELRAAQEKGGNPQDAMERHRAALKGLVGRAEKILGEAGRSSTSDTVDRVWSTLRAGSLDPDGQSQLLEGRLDQEIESSGFPAGLTIQRRGGAPKPAKDSRSKQAARDEETRQAGDEVRRTREELQELKSRLRDLEKNERDAEKAWRRAAAEAEEARAAVAGAEQRLAEARERA